MKCPICGTEMTLSTVESTFLEDVLRCPLCQHRKTRRSATCWALRVGAAIVGIIIGVPVNPGD
jgi:DNA-directed RNA polymerase subunit RPC12/RpoP